MGGSVSVPDVVEPFKAIQENLDMARVAEIVSLFKENHMDFAGGVDVIASLLEGDRRRAALVVDKFGDGRTMNVLSFLAGLAIFAKGDRREILQTLYELFDLEDAGTLTTTDLTVVLLSTLRAMVIMIGKGRDPVDVDCERLAVATGSVSKDDFCRFVTGLAPGASSLEHVMHRCGVLSEADLPPPPPLGQVGAALEATAQYVVCSFVARQHCLAITAVDAETGAMYEGTCSTAELKKLTGQANPTTSDIVAVASHLRQINGCIVVGERETSTPETPTRTYVATVGVAFLGGRYCECSLWTTSDSNLLIRGYDVDVEAYYEGHAPVGTTFESDVACRLRIVEDERTIVYNPDAPCRSAPIVLRGRLTSHEHVATLGIAFHSGQYAVTSFWRAGQELWIQALFDGGTVMHLTSQYTDDVYTDIAPYLFLSDDKRLVLDRNQRSLPEKHAASYVATTGLALDSNDFLVVSYYALGPDKVAVRGFDPEDMSRYETVVEDVDANDCQRVMASHLRIENKKLVFDASYRGSAPIFRHTLDCRHVSTVRASLSGVDCVCSFFSEGNTTWVQAYDPVSLRAYETSLDSMLTPQELASRLALVDGELFVSTTTLGLAVGGQTYCVCSFFWRPDEIVVRGFDPRNDQAYHGTLVASDWSQLGVGSVPASKARDLCHYVVPHLRISKAGRIVLDPTCRATAVASPTPSKEKHAATVGVSLRGYYLVTSWWTTSEGGFRVQGFDPDTDRGYSGTFGPMDFAPIGAVTPDMSCDEVHDLCAALATYLHISGQSRLVLRTSTSGQEGTLHHVLCAGLVLGDARFVCSFWALPSGRVRLRAFDVASDAMLSLELDADAPLLGLKRDDAAAVCLRLAKRVGLSARGELRLLNDAVGSPTPLSRRHLSTIGIRLSNSYLICSFWQQNQSLVVKGFDPESDTTHEGRLTQDDWAPLGLGSLDDLPLAKTHDFCHYLAPQLAIATSEGRELVLSDAARAPALPGARLGRPLSAKRSRHKKTAAAPVAAHKPPTAAAPPPPQEAPAPDVTACHRFHVAIAEALPPAPPTKTSCV